MPRTWREKLAPHIYRDAYGIDTIVQFRGRVLRERWPLDADWDEMQRWIARALAELHDRAADAGTVRPSRTTGTLTADVETFLKTRKGRPGYAADKCHLKAWAALFKRKRSRIKTADVDLAIAGWREAKVAPQTIIHRCRALRVLWRSFDKNGRTPVDDAQIPKKPKPHPVGLPAGTVAKVTKRLTERASKYANTREKTLARYRVLTTTLQRPIQLMRSTPQDVDLQLRVWLVPGAKGEPSHQIWLNDDMLEAWRAFIKAEAWGPYHSGRYGKQLRAAGYPEDVSTYNVRHDGAIDALRRGADLGDVQGLLGHTEITTTRRNYAPILKERQQQISERLQGRLK
jgi:site-specific recombinase XerD